MESALAIESRLAAMESLTAFRESESIGSESRTASLAAAPLRERLFLLPSCENAVQHIDG